MAYKVYWEEDNKFCSRQIQDDKLVEYLQELYKRIARDKILVIWIENNG